MLLPDPGFYVGKVVERHTDLLLLFSKVVFLVVNPLFPEGIITSETDSHFSRCGDFNKHPEITNQASGLQVCDL